MLYCKFCNKSTKQNYSGMELFINGICLSLYKCSICYKTNRKLGNNTILNFMKEINTDSIIRNQ